MRAVSLLVPPMTANAVLSVVLQALGVTTVPPPDASAATLPWMKVFSVLWPLLFGCSPSSDRPEV